MENKHDLFFFNAFQHIVQTKYKHRIYVSKSTKCDKKFVLNCQYYFAEKERCFLICLWMQKVLMLQCSHWGSRSRYHRYCIKNQCNRITFPSKRLKKTKQVGGTLNISAICFCVYPCRSLVERTAFPKEWEYSCIIFHLTPILQCYTVRVNATQCG